MRSSARPPARRRTRRRRSRRGGRTYTLGYLITRQPKTIARMPGYRAMRDHYLASPALRSARIPARAYRLLNEAILAPENLEHFYRTYRLPRNPFFPLFLAIKRAYLNLQEERRVARRAWIRDAVRSLPPAELSMIRYLGHLERALHPGSASPLWERELYPATKKRAREYLSSSANEWVQRFRTHLRHLSQAYRGFGVPAAERLLAAYILGLIPETAPGEKPPVELPPRRPAAADLAAAFRRESLASHPDRGGDARRFIQVKWARDTLLSSER